MLLEQSVYLGLFLLTEFKFQHLPAALKVLKFLQSTLASHSYTLLGFLESYLGYVQLMSQTRKIFSTYSGTPCLQLPALRYSGPKSKQSWRPWILPSVSSTQWDCHYFDSVPSTTVWKILLGRKPEWMLDSPQLFPFSKIEALSSLLPVLANNLYERILE